MNIYDIGENDLISVDFNLEGNPNGEYIINIISQELRYEKKINHYIPKIFTKYIERPKKRNNKNNILTIVLISIGGFIVLVLLLYLILRCVKKRKEIDFTKKAQEIQETKLLNEL